MQFEPAIVIQMKRCVICDAALSGRKKRFCSRKCKNSDTNNRNQSYLAQQARGRERKHRLIKICGGKCNRCEYSRNLAALEFHHLDSTTKQFNLDLRSLSNRRWSVILVEAMKCELVCSNCHKEIHNPDCLIET